MMYVLCIYTYMCLNTYIYIYTHIHIHICIFKPSTPAGLRLLEPAGHRVRDPPASERGVRSRAAVQYFDPSLSVCLPLSLSLPLHLFIHAYASRLLSFSIRTFSLCLQL